MGFRSEDSEPCLPLPRAESLDNRGRASVRDCDRSDSLVEGAGDVGRADAGKERCAAKRSGVTEEGTGTGGKGPEGGDDGGGLLWVRVAATDLGEHGDIALGLVGETGFVETGEVAHADDAQLVADAKRDGLFKRLLGV